MSSRQRSAPSYLAAYHGSSGDDGDDHSSDEDALEDDGGRPKRKRAGRAARGGGGGGGGGARGRSASGRGGRASFAAAAVAPRERSARTAAAASRASVTAAFDLEFSDEEDEYAEASAARPSPAAAAAASSFGTRSARLQGQKRKIYAEPAEDDFGVSSEDESTRAQGAAPSKRGRGRPKKSSAASGPQYLDLNGCLGKANIDRILARKRMPAPPAHFMCTFVAQLPPELQAQLHPDDMERFAPELFKQHHAQNKEREAAAMEEQRRKAAEEQASSIDGLDASMVDSAALSLDAAATSVAPLPETSSLGSFRAFVAPGADELWYLIKWKDHSYSPLSLQWMPHSLLTMFEDHAMRLRRFETTRNNGEASKAHARQSKSDEELEEDEQRTIQLALSLRTRALDERAIRAQVAIKEDTIRAQQEALRAPPSSTLAALLAEPSTDGAAAAAAADSSPAAAAAADSSAVLTPAQVREVESRLESLRISRRLADLHNDHKLGRMKRIRAGYFDANFLGVERIIAHRRRGNTAARRNIKRFFGDTQPSHWSYYGLTTPSAVHALQRSVASYVTQVNLSTKRFMFELAEAIDPRVRMQRDAWEALLLRKPAPAAAPASNVTPKPEDDEEMKQTDSRNDNPEEEKSLINVQPTAADLTSWMNDGDDGDEKEQSVQAASAPGATPPPPVTSVSPATAASPPPRRASSARSRASPPAVSAAAAAAAPAADPSPPAVHASGRPRRAATGRRKVLESDPEDDGNGASYVPSDDDTDLQATLRASVRDSRRRRTAAASAAAAFDEDQYGDGLDDYAAEDPVAVAEVSDDDGIVDEDDPNASEQFEFLVKWVQLPYEHCTWETRADLRRLDEMRKEMDSTTQMEESSPELNPAVPIPLLAMLPFVPLSSLLFSNNLLLKYAELPIIVSDAQHAAILPHVSQPSAYKALHPTIPISLVQDIGPVAASSNTAVRSSCISALHRYLHMHSTKTRHAAIVYPQIKGCAGAADLAAARNSAADKQSPAAFTMRAAAVDKSDRFGPKGELSLREYQLHGVNFMALNWSVGRNSVLADEMGLGKTVQASILLNWMVTRQHLTQPILIVAPLSTLGFWLREIDRWTDLHGVIYRGSPESRKVIREWEWSWPNAAAMNELDALRREEGVDISAMTASQRLVSPVTASTPVQRRSHKFNVLITSYEFIINDFNLLSKIKFSALVIDEAQRLKNATSRLFEKLQQLKIPRRLLLTGTPIQNDLKELFALLHFIDAGQFHSESDFLAQCGSMTTLDQVTKLFHFLRPVVLRRLKSDVEKNLPNKDEILIEIQLTNMQKKYYRAVYERNFKLLTNAATAQGGAAKLTAGLRNISMQLRKVCNHPYLLDDVEREELESLQSKLPAPAILTSDVVMDALVSSSGKMLLLDKLLPKLKHEGHRVLIFSQMTRVLDILSDYLHYRRYKHERLDGNVAPPERQMAIDKFSEPNSDIFAFLLSTRAGGLGITLTAADTVILFDSDWNLLNDKQAQDRAHRIGQEKDVRVFRLITKNTYESQMFQRACQKLTLDHVIMASLSQSVSTGGALPNVGLDAHGNRSRKKMDLIGTDALDASFNETDDSGAPTSAAPFDRREVEQMLKHGAYGVFSASNAESDLQSIRFAEEDIDGILSRSQLVKYGDEQKSEDAAFKVEVVSKADGSGGGAAKTGSTFSKASFIPAGGGEELSMSDPLFWQKLGMEDKSAPEPTNMTDAAEVLDTKRIRKPVQTFNANADDGDSSDDSAYGDRDFAAKKSGPAVCPICEEVVKISAANPVLECARCEDQSHLSCLGLGAIPAEDLWYCPACVREMKSKSKKARPQAKEDAEDEEEYRPQKHQELAWKRAAMMMENNNNHSNNSSSHNKPLASTPASSRSNPFPQPVQPVVPQISLQQFTEQLASSPPSAADLESHAASHRAQYDRLMGTFRITQPGKSDAHYRRLADELWAATFKSQPPSAVSATRPPATPLAASSTPLSGRIHRPIADMKAAAAARASSAVASAPLPPPQLMPPSPFQSLLAPAPAHSYQPIAQVPPPLSSGLHPAVMSQPQPHPFAPPSASPSSAAAHAKCGAASCSKMDGAPGVPSFNLCGQCRSVRYCSRACQAQDWKATHKAKCKETTQAKTEA